MDRNNYNNSVRLLRGGPKHGSGYRPSVSGLDRPSVSCLDVPTSRKTMPSHLDPTQSGMKSASKYVTEHDRKMASQQTQIESLTGDERSKQESWAQSQLGGLSTNCVAGCRWNRIRGGYKCDAGICLVTDELLAEGRGGFYQDCRSIRNGSIRKGPFYPGDHHYEVGFGGMMMTRR